MDENSEVKNKKTTKSASKSTTRSTKSSDKKSVKNTEKKAVKKDSVKQKKEPVKKKSVKKLDNDNVEKQIFKPVEHEVDKEEELSKTAIFEKIDVSDLIVKEEKEKDIDPIINNFSSNSNISNNNENESVSKKKSSFSTSEVIVIMFITVLFGLLIGGFIVYHKYDKSTTVSEDDELSEVIKVYNDIVDNYYHDSVSKSELIDAAIEGMVGTLDDPYSVYINKKANDTFDEQLAGYFIGIGVEVYKLEDDYPTINSVIDDTPAKEAGLEVNDKIIKVRGNDVTGMNLDSVVALIKDGKEGEEFTIVVKRGEEEKEIKIKLGKVDLQSVYVAYLDNEDKKIALVSIVRFSLNTYSQFRKAYDEIKNSNVDGMIIDLRSNAGGYLSAAYNIASMFVDKDVIVYKEDTKGNIQDIKSVSDKIIDMPVSIIVNSQSASASEVLSISLKENIGAPIVGNRTYGKGTIQRLHDLSSGASIKITIQKWLSPKGNSVDGVGITPDYEVDLPNEFYEVPTITNDHQLVKAIEVLFK